MHVTELRDPHRLLGPHLQGDSVVVRAFRPEATGVTVVLDTGTRVPARRVHDDGLFEAELPPDAAPDPRGAYRLEVEYGEHTLTVDDPYRFWPTLGDVDLHLLGEGKHRALWRHLGAHAREHEGVAGTAFAVWAPNARGVRVVGDFNAWDGRVHLMRMLGSSGVWELFVPAVGPGTRYKFEIVTAHGDVVLKADPFAAEAEHPPGTASLVSTSDYVWGDDAWLAARATVDPLQRPLSVYEVHLGSWRHGLDYRALAEELPGYVADLGFTHVELLPVAHHPFAGSWGYQVTSYYAPLSTLGRADDFRYLVDRLHQAGIGVIVDWVPAHFPKDDWALARFDGTALYEHADPRQGEHPDWGTLVFNVGRNEVRNFLVANALYWIEEFHVDGLRVDAVASMLYLDYSREAGGWVPNAEGGRENLEAVAFLQETNEVLYGLHPGVMTLAEESTAWPGVSRPTDMGGLGFGFKWNMGWMHDTLHYFSTDPVHRKHHHQELTFGLLYAFSENFVLPLSHDEVVHGKGSLAGKMPGDAPAQVAHLRALLAWMWAHPGRTLLFMGGELAQWREWSHDASLDWYLLDDPAHRGVHDFVRALNRVARDEPALWERDFDESGFRWIVADDADHNVFAFARFDASGERVVVCVANLADAAWSSYRVGAAARWPLGRAARHVGPVAHGRARHGTGAVERAPAVGRARSPAARGDLALRPPSRSLNDRRRSDDRDRSENVGSGRALHARLQVAQVAPPDPTQDRRARDRAGPRAHPQREGEALLPGEAGAAVTAAVEGEAPGAGDEADVADPDHPALAPLGDLHAVGEAEGPDARVAVEGGADTVAGADVKRMATASSIHSTCDAMSRTAAHTRSRGAAIVVLTRTRDTLTVLRGVASRVRCAPADLGQWSFRSPSRGSCGRPAPRADSVVTARARTRSRARAATRLRTASGLRTASRLRTASGVGAAAAAAQGRQCPHRTASRCTRWAWATSSTARSSCCARTPARPW